MVVSMERWIGKVAIVTGASSGIGAAIARKLAENGMIVVGLARRKEQIDEVSKSLKKCKGQLHGIRCDMSKEEEILKAFQLATEKLGPVHVLVNNAGIVQDSTLSDGDAQQWRNVLDVNVLGLCIATREAVRIMKKCDIKGHIVHINSILGHFIPPEFSILNMYIGAKHGITGLAEVLRLELASENVAIKITNLSPGMVKSNIVHAGGFDNSFLGKAFEQDKILDVEDIADAVIFAISTPPHVQVIAK
ncbi:hypothetical protein HUJ05_006609 [Dendroctonus ponderosae]|nr:hypothetical protein HUJ05_006609 [Dendroctonus ponderosae]